jgi:3-oxoacyl-[acyl-carrier protein] reductase
MTDWAGRSVIVTGASRGIGEALAVEASRRAAHVALLARDVSALEHVASACRQAAPDGTPDPIVTPADVTDAAEIPRVIADVLAGFDGRLDLLANVAGSALRHVRVEEATDDDWEATLALNLVAPARLQRLCFDALRAARGAVVNVGSIAAQRSAPQGVAYAAAKAGLSSLSRTAAIEWARHGIRVNTVEPGFVDTAFNDEVRSLGLEDRLVAKVPMRRAISPEEVARLILAVADPDLPSVSGTVVTIDGAWSARL